MSADPHGEFAARTRDACAAAGIELGRASWDPRRHPRRGHGPGGGQFARVPGGGGKAAPLPWDESGGTAHYAGSLGIAREDMPQLSGMAAGKRVTSAEMLPQFTAWLRARGVKVTARRIPAAALRPSQSTGDTAAIRGIAGALRSGTMKDTKPVTVSSDNRVIDGHHNWAGRLLADSEGGRPGLPAGMPVNQADLPAAELISAARQFAAEKGIAPRRAGEHAPQPGGGPDPAYLAHTQQIERGIRDALARGEATDAKYAIDADRGIWQPERARLHKQIVNDLYRRQAAGVPAQGRAVIAGGLGGAGKTTVLTGHAGIDPGKYVTLNPDDVKEEMARRGLIPRVPGLSPMESAALVHEESSHITNLLAKRAMLDHKNVIWDITMSSKGSAQRRVDELRAAGYGSITGIFVDIPVETSVERALARHQRGMSTPLGGRYVPPAIIRKAAAGDGSTVNRQAFDALRSQFDGWQLYDNSGSAPKKVASGLWTCARRSPRRRTATRRTCSRWSRTCPAVPARAPTCCPTTTPGRSARGRRSMT